MNVIFLADSTTSKQLEKVGLTVANKRVIVHSYLDETVFNQISKPLQESSDSTYIIYTSLKQTIAQSLIEMIDVNNLNELMIEHTQQLISLYKANRSSVKLISLEGLIADQSMNQELGLAEFVNKIETSNEKDTMPDIYSLVAEYLFVQSKALQKLNAQLEACSVLNPIEITSLSANEVLQAFTSEQNSKNQQIDMLTEAKAQLEQDLAHSQNALKKEQQLTSQQTAELNSIKDKLAQEQKANKDQVQDLANQLKQIEAENELIIQQLHHVQEELEYQFISKSELSKQHSIVSSSRRDAETYSIWIRGLYQKSAKAHYKVSRRFRNTLKKQIQLITQSTLFDKQWYLDTYPDLREANIEPALHYLLFGVAEGRNPSASFNTMNYIFTYTDVAESGLNPLVHYIKFGQSENREADPRRKCLPAPKNIQ